MSWRRCVYVVSGALNFDVTRREFISECLPFEKKGKSCRYETIGWRHNLFCIWWFGERTAETMVDWDLNDDARPKSERLQKSTARCRCQKAFRKRWKQLMQFGAQKIAHSYLIRHDKINCPPNPIVWWIHCTRRQCYRKHSFGGLEKMVAKKDARQQWNYIFSELFRMLWYHRNCLM